MDSLWPLGRRRGRIASISTHGSRIRHPGTASGAAANSFPEVMMAYQEWMSRRMERFAEDSRRFWADAQKLMEASTRMVPQADSWMSGKRPGTTS
jgi:hypothetical protein